MQAQGCGIVDRNWFTLAGAKYIGRDKNKQVAATHPLPTTHCTPIHVSFSQRLGGDLPGVHGLHYGFLLSLELERVLPLRPQEKKQAGGIYECVCQTPCIIYASLSAFSIPRLCHLEPMQLVLSIGMHAEVPTPCSLCADNPRNALNPLAQTGVL